MFFLTCGGCSLSSRATTLASLSYFAIIAYKDISTDVIAFVDCLMLFGYLRRFVIVDATKLSFLVCYHNFVVCKAQDFNISSDDFLKFFKLKVCSVLWSDFHDCSVCFYNFCHNRCFFHNFLSFCSLIITFVPCLCCLHIAKIRTFFI